LLPVERRQKIEKLIRERKNMKISELSSSLNVSEMTIHRDLVPLIDAGIVEKSFGGVSLIEKQQVHNDHICTYCSSPINYQLRFQLILTNDRHEMTCCAHCGLLRYRELKENVVQAICYDFLRQTTLSAQLATYVMDTSLDISCCQPQVLSFQHEVDAKKFVTGFSGGVYSFSKAIETVFQRMKST